MGIETTERIQGLPVLAPEGAVDITNSAAVRDAMLEELEAGTRQLILDLSLVSYIDSSGLSALVGVATSFEKAQGHLILCGVDPTVMKVLEMTRLTDYFTLVEDRDAAVRSAQELSGD